MDIIKNDSFAPKVEYLFINYSHEIIDLSICNINIYIAFNITEEDLNLYTFVSNQGYLNFIPSDHLK